MIYGIPLAGNVRETKNIRRFFLRFNELSEFKFKPGQHVKIEFPIPSKKNYRQYSIANAPNGSNIIELLIVLDPNGMATPYLLNKVDIGSYLKVSEARGNFIYNEDIKTDIIMICTGTGLAPLRSIYLDIYNRNLEHKNIYLVFGTRYMHDMIYLDEMQELGSTGTFFFYPVLSREQSAEWNGERGYVHNVYKKIINERRDFEIYICGWREMVSEARQNLLTMGFNRNQIHFERYD